MVQLKKGQIESFGLVIIVVLLVLIFVLFLYLKINSSDNSDADRILEVKANNLRNSVLKTTLCNRVSIKDEILNCDEIGNGNCGSCEELKEKITKILDNSLEDNINYEFEPYSLKRGTCRERIAASTQPLSTNIEVDLNLCYQRR
ncbi:hypothetical protein CL617_03750 [archaeon]|nr:hypothetical protein [archaeon]|tara:strand:+ start:5375 stop:5809 length:435 start_codon:yes stop_codon:yes gene_type:complete